MAGNVQLGMRHLVQQDFDERDDALAHHHGRHRSRKTRASNTL